MRKAYIKHIAYHLPEHIYSNKDIIRDFPEWSEEKIISKIGISERHIVGDKECASDLGIKAAEKLFLENSFNRDSVDFILFCSQSPDFILPTTACIIQHKLNIPTTAGALDFNLGCSGYIYGLSVAKGLVCSGIANNVLLITAETYSKYIHPMDKGNRAIFGDGAAATLVSISGFAEICDFVLGTDGAGAENLIIKTRGSRNQYRENFVVYDYESNPKSADHLYMNGSEIFKFTAEKVPQLVQQLLEKNFISKNADLFVFHQANAYMINYLRKRMQIPEENFFVHIDKCANTVSSTIPIALYEAKRSGHLAGNIVLVGFGVGYSWGGVVVKCF